MAQINNLSPFGSSGRRSLRAPISKDWRLMPIFPTLIFLAVLSVPCEQASAASFDCTDAKTAVEKRICANPELSRLDEQLTVAYREAIRNVVEKDNVRFRQQEWLKRRDRCETDACIKAAYGGQIILLVEAAKARPGVGVVAGPKRYPPYPDVWRVVLPEVSGGTSQFGGIWASPNGDVMIGYVKERRGWRAPSATGKCDDQLLYAYRGFFGGQEALLSCEEHLDVLRLVPFRTPGALAESALNLSDGGRIRELSVPGAPGGAGCRVPVPTYLERTDGRGSVLWRKSVLRILKEPETMACPGAVDDKPYEVHVKSLDGLLFPLEDETFLFLMAPGQIVRFNAGLTNYTYGQEGVFIIDTAVVDKTREQCRGDGACLDREIVNYLNKQSPRRSD